MLPVGQTIRHWRISKRVKQAELASRSGVTRPNLSAIEQGKRDVTLATLSTLARALGISTGQLLDQQPPLPAGLNDRHQIDAIARAIVFGERGFSPQLNRLSDDVAALISNQLAAFSAPGHKRVSHLVWHKGQRRAVARRQYGANLVTRLLKRVEKHLPHAI